MVAQFEDITPESLLADFEDIPLESLQADVELMISRGGDLFDLEWLEAEPIDPLWFESIDAPCGSSPE